MKINNNNIRWEPPIVALEKWDSNIRAKADAEHTINIYSVIGEDYWDGDGMTAKIVSSILRKADGEDITVNINSPGGSFFEGIAIHNLLKNYDGEINVKIIGLAASAASIVAIAGDTIEIAKSGFFMIHNAWTCACGNRHDMQDVINMLGEFDESMGNLYADHTGISASEITSMMDDESWINGKNAVDKGFATSILDDNEFEDEKGDDKASALRKIDITLAKSKMPRSERRKLIKDLSTPSGEDDGTPSATAPTPSAGDVEALERLIKSLKS